MTTVNIIVSVATFLNVLLCFVSCKDSHAKRLLVNDPHAIQDQMTHIQEELQVLQTTVQTQAGKITSLEQQLSQAEHGTGGATFVRWGRTDCPANLTELVYSGYAGGSFYTHKGAAANYVCLPREPVWGPYKDLPNDDYSARMYGAEYESHPSSTPFGSQSRDKDVPCAVCRTTSFISSVMIPARATCFSGWTKAYSGSLAAGNYNFAAASEYICVDEHAQSVVGGVDANENGALFFAVKAECGSLRCPPYEQNKYLSCVVCMK
ncbi:short-chain collagen C4-like [Mizuhopecten yessoensis]|uniref:short-chain collagen C4-like n=1 Tax=Mizuhopecten yessoensis TaxID=6573 RepID=UPI000B45E802|nr:short-chain collagen C4-like [Mizuhopecten yessoensis]